MSVGERKGRRDEEREREREGQGHTGKWKDE